jgi:hypothetical protein
MPAARAPHPQQRLPLHQPGVRGLWVRQQQQQQQQEEKGALSLCVWVARCSVC